MTTRSAQAPDAASPPARLPGGPLALLCVLLVVILAGPRVVGLLRNGLSSGETLSDYVVPAMAADGAGCVQETCTFRTVTAARAGAGAARALVVPAKVHAPQVRRVQLNPEFNRAYSLSRDGAGSLDAWTPSNGNDPLSPPADWTIHFTWYSGQQRWSRLTVPGPGYIGALAEAGDAPPVHVSHFVADGQGHRLSDARADDPSPHAFVEAFYQPVPAELRLSLPHAQARLLSRDASVEVAVDLLNVLPFHVDPPQAKVVAIDADPGDPAAMLVTVLLDEPSRRIWQQMSFRREAFARQRGMPRQIDVAIAGNGGRSAGDYVWVPRRALGRLGEEEGHAVVWGVFGGFTAPIRVAIGRFDDDRAAVIEAPPPGSVTAIARDDWSRLTPYQRQSVLRSLGDPPQNLHLHPGVPLIATAPEGLRAGAPARSGEGR